ncbi:hypothetical protein [Alistipes putredinis]|uniref:hypothetical protein n=1 Tax=Alistipes putredinis TaxID=28117 RepID=UPI003FD88890
MLPQQQVARYVVREYQQKYPGDNSCISCVHQSRLTGLTTTRPNSIRVATVATAMPMK